MHYCYLLAIWVFLLGSGVQAQNVTFPRQDGTLTGWLYRPELSDGTGVLLLGGGDVSSVALKLTHAGYTVLAPESQGTLIHDLDAAFSFLEQQVKGVDIRPRVAILGVGPGGETAFSYALENEDLKGAVNYLGRPWLPLERVGQLEVPLLGIWTDADSSTLAEILRERQKSFEFSSASDQSWAQVLTFLQKMLRGG